MNNSTGSVFDEAAEAIANLLPAKSKKKYESCYQFFNDWRRMKNVTEKNKGSKIKCHICLF